MVARWLKTRALRARQFMPKRLAVYLALLCITQFLSTEIAHAACGGTVRTWDAGAGNTRWHTNDNWNPDNQPNSGTEDAVIVGAGEARFVQLVGEYLIRRHDVVDLQAQFLRGGKVRELPFPDRLGHHVFVGPLPVPRGS